jgi:hypothetical protein
MLEFALFDDVLDDTVEFKLETNAGDVVIAMEGVANSEGTLDVFSVNGACDEDRIAELLDDVARVRRRLAQETADTGVVV